MDQLLVVHHRHLFPQVPRFINLSPFVLAILSVCSVASADFLVSLRNAYFDAGVNRLVRLSESGEVLGEFIPGTEVSASEPPQWSHRIALHRQRKFAGDEHLWQPTARVRREHGGFPSCMAPNVTSPPSPALDGPTALRQAPMDSCWWRTGGGGERFYGRERDAH